jgi:MFS family permease
MKEGNRAARRFALHQFVHWAAVGVMVPVMTLVLRELGLSLFQVGVAMAIYSLTTVILEVPSGALADLWGRRKTYLLATAADIAAALLFILSRELMLVLAAASLRGAARAFASGSLEALVVGNIRRLDPAFDLQRFFSRVGMVVPAGLALTSLGGGFLPELAALPLLEPIAAGSPAQGFSVNLLVNALLTALAGLLAWTLFSEDTPRRASQGAAEVGPGAVFRQIIRALRLALARRSLGLVLASTFAVGLVLHAVETFWQPRLNMIVATETVLLFGVLGSGYFAVAVLGNALSPALVRMLRGNRAAASLVFRMLSGGALVVLALQSSAGGFAAGYLGFFVLYAITMPIHAAMLNELVPDAQRATLISTGSLIMQVGGFLGSLAFGVVSQAAGIGWSWAIAGVAFMASALLFVPLIREHARTPGRAEIAEAPA